MARILGLRPVVEVVVHVGWCCHVHLDINILDDLRHIARHLNRVLDLAISILVLVLVLVLILILI